MEASQIVINDLQTLHLIFRGYRSHDGLGSWFRGHADAAWELLPKAGRPDFFLPNSRDLGRFNDWRGHAVAHGRLPEGDVEQLALAQHHGLATRLLDWTKNPLVACYFACCELPDVDGCIYIVETPERMVLPGTPLEMLATLEGVFGYMPNAINTRLVNQRGMFTIHCDARARVELRASRIDSTRSNLLQVRIPSSMKKEVLNMVADYGVDRWMLFPDLDGLSLRLNARTFDIVEREILRRDAKSN